MGDRAAVFIYSDLAFAAIIVGVTAVAVYLLARNMRENLKKARQNERAIAESLHHLQMEIAERQQAAEALNQRDSILEGVTYAAERFLKMPDWQANIQDLLARLGEGRDVSHVYLFENHLAADGTPVTSQRYEWVAPNIRSDLHNPEFQEVPLYEPEFARWHQNLSQDQPFYGSLSTFTPTEAAYMIPRGVKSLLDVPIFVGGEWWGIIGFDDCVKEHAWSPAEIDAIKVAASVIGAAIQRQRTETALKEREAHYRGAITAAGLVPYVIDYRTKTFTFMGEGIMNLIGYTADEFTPQLFRQSVREDYMWGPNANVSPQEARHKFLAGELREWRSDMRVETRTGESRWLSDASIELTDERGKAKGAIGILQDITERKRAEEEIRQLNEALEQRVRERTAQLELANRELEAFTYSVSHDLRAPLRTMAGFSQILSEDYSHALDAEALSHLSRIQKSADHMGQLIDDLLALSRLGQQALRLRPLSTGELKMLVEQVVVSLQVEARGRTVTVNIGDLLACQADPALLQQVFVNLLSNAFKYTRQQIAAQIDIGVADTPQGSAYFVRDNGAGFDMQYANKLFGVFQRLHRADEFEGTGVGLATVKRIIDRHHGRIWAEAQEGRGATFYFTLGASQ